MVKNSQTICIILACMFSGHGHALQNFLRPHNPPEKSQIPEALITIGQGANNLAKQGITIQAQSELVESLNNVAQSAHELADKGISISFSDSNIGALNNAAFNIIKSGCVAMVGTGLSLLSIYYLYKSCFYIQTTHNLSSEQKKAIHNRGIFNTRLLLPLISIVGLSAGLTMIKKCEQIAR